MMLSATRSSVRDLVQRSTYIPGFTFYYILRQSLSSCWSTIWASGVSSGASYMQNEGKTAKVLTDNEGSRRLLRHKMLGANQPPKSIMG